MKLNFFIMFSFYVCIKIYHKTGEELRSIFLYLIIDICEKQNQQQISFQLEHSLSSPMENVPSIHIYTGRFPVDSPQESWKESSSRLHFM